MQSACIEVIFEPKTEYDPNFEEFLEEYFEVVVCNLLGNKQQIVAYANQKFDEKNFLQKAQNLQLPKYELKVLTSANWLKDYVIEFTPFEVENFLIYGVHEKQTPKTDKIALKVYAGTAFGSGHNTTQACITAISDLYKKQSNHANILDMGCGSGILSLAAAKLWPEAKIVAADIDEEAVLVTNQNALDNNVQDSINAQAGDGYHTFIVPKNAPYDIILANILARPLIEMAPQMAKYLKTGGYGIISGFVDEQEDWVVAEHQKFGLQPIKSYKFENWRAVLLEKK